MSNNQRWTAKIGKSPNALLVDVDCNTDKDFWVLLRSDAHHDNPGCNQELERKHLDEAVDCGAAIIDCGDLFCAMQGKYDKRSSKSAVRPEHQNGEYLDSLVSTAAEFYQPYAHNILSLGYGNHETAILKRHETNLTERLAERLRTLTGAPVHTTGYAGWIRLRLHYTTSTANLNLFHFHGSGGGGPVTQDTIQAQRIRSYVEGADVIVTGHTHDCWAQQSTKITLDRDGLVKHKPVWNIKCPTYKDEYKSGQGGWHIETGKPPKPLGAWWLHLTFRKSSKDCTVDIETVKAS